MGRRIGRYIQEREELDALLAWLVEAIRRDRHPVFYLRGATKDARKSREASELRNEEHVQEQLDSGALQLADDGEEKTFAVWAPSTDPLLKKRLDAALAQLTKGQRQIFLLDVDGYTSPEIAALLEVSDGGVRVRLAEARKILRNVLADVSPLPKGKL
jgi:RNA polymerase sigma factor (sigma-70 family)